MHEAGSGFWQGDGKYCGWRSELDEFLSAGIYGTESGEQGRRGGKRKAGVDTLNKSNVYTEGNMLPHGDEIIITVFFFSEFLSSHLSWELYGSVSFLFFWISSWISKADLTETKSQQQPRNCLAAFRKAVWKRSASGLTPSLPELCGPSGRQSVPKNVNNASELSAGLNEPFRGQRQLKLKPEPYL